MRDADEMRNAVGKGATIQECDTTIRRWDDVESKMRTV